jgi:hypothetical protein
MAWVVPHNSRTAIGTAPGSAPLGGGGWPGTMVSFIVSLKSYCYRNRPKQTSTTLHARSHEKSHHMLSQNR